QHLELGVDPRLEPAEHLEDELLVEDDRRVRLFRGDGPHLQQLTAETREAFDRRKLDDALRSLQHQPGAHGADELPRELRIVQAVDLQLALAQRVEHLVDVVRAGVVAHLDEGERELRLRRSNDDRLEHLCVRHRARLRGVPPLLQHVLDQRALVEIHSAAAFSWNQKNPRGASVSRYDSSPIAGKRVRPNISSGTIPANSCKSSSTAWADRARLCTQSTMSSSQRLTWAKILVFSGCSGSYVPSPKTGCSFRRAMKRWSQRRNDVGVRSCASTFTAW